MANSIEPILQVEEIFDEFRNEAIAMGVTRLIWFIPPPAHEVRGAAANLLSWGFEDAWRDLYHNKEIGARRVVDRLIQSGKPIKWSQIVEQMEPVPLVSSFVQEFELSGFAFPVYAHYFYQTLISCAIHPPLESFDDHRFLMLLGLASSKLRQIAEVQTHEARNRAKLSPRELDIVRALGSGKSKKEIARDLGISHSSVDTYSRRVFSKLDVDDRVEAVVKSISMGLIRL